GCANAYVYRAGSGEGIFCLAPCPPLWGEGTEASSALLTMVARRLLAVMPRLANARVRSTRRGLYPMTPDGFTLIGWSDTAEGYLYAVGMCGQGFMLG